jgi:hypothetical protein
MLALNKLAAETTQLAVDTLYIHLRVMEHLLLMLLSEQLLHLLHILSINFCKHIKPCFGRVFYCLSL